MTQANELNRAALEQLHRRLEKPLFNLMYRWVWNRDEARDLVQDAFVKLWRHRDEVDASLAEPLVYRIALNLAANRLRARKLWKWTGLEAVMGESSEVKSAQAALEQNEEQQRVRRAVESLPEKQKAVLLMFEFSGMGHKEISETLQIPIGTVGSRRSAALEALKAKLEETR